MRTAFGLFGTLLLLPMMFVLSASPVRGQDKDKDKDKKDDNRQTEEVALTTCDGLRLAGTWYPASKGRQADCVIMVHNYGKEFDSRKGAFPSLAKDLQDAGFSVLTFDLRGHGRSTRAATVFDPKLFTDLNLFPWNRNVSGIPTPQKALTMKSINVSQFNTNYFPYMINDIVAARRFLDERNDAGQCNAGAVHVIADRESGSLAMAWLHGEYLRNGINALQLGGVNPKHVAGTDIMSATFLSYRPTQKAGQITKHLEKEKPLFENIGFVRESVREKVSMAFVYGDGDEKAKAASRAVFTGFGIPAGAKEDKDRGKYLVEVEKGSTLAGIDLLDQTRVPGVDKKIIEFIKATTKKNITGNAWKQRNPGTYDPQSFPFASYMK